MKKEINWGNFTWRITESKQKEIGRCGRFEINSTGWQKHWLIRFLLFQLDFLHIFITLVKKRKCEAPTDVGNLNKKERPWDKTRTGCSALSWGGRRGHGWVGGKQAASALKPAVTAPELDPVGLQHWSEAAVRSNFTWGASMANRLTTTGRQVVNYTVLSQRFYCHCLCTHCSRTASLLLRCLYYFTVQV